MNKIINRTLRYCCVCKKNTFFEYNHLIGHSRCVYCLQGFGLPVKDFELCKEKIIDLINKRIGQLLVAQGDARRITECKKIIELIKEVKQIE